MCHHELLHLPASENEINVELEAKNMGNPNSGSCLPQLMKIPTESGSGVNILWDGGSTLSLITFQKAKELGLSGKSVRLAVTKVGGETAELNPTNMSLG